ncbi:hypothetical protein GCM10023333_20920 [Ferrimonas pelagia]|uniref:Lipoprotein n=1 Tax=Ferrimonas pelagia TaxID=1177826 RepID=A0ABP9ETW3_9GAMM
MRFKGMIAVTLILLVSLLPGCATKEYANEVDRILAEEQLCLGEVDTNYTIGATIWSSDGKVNERTPSPSAKSRCVTDRVEQERLRRERQLGR